MLSVTINSYANCYEIVQLISILLDVLQNKNLCCLLKRNHTNT